ncbi:MAG: hypothetical protein ACFCUO_13355 [Rhodospirillales bacterium]
MRGPVAGSVRIVEPRDARRWQGESGVRHFLGERWPELTVATGVAVMWLAIVAAWFDP